MGTPPRRTRAVVADQIREIERHLRDLPPHSGSGHREELRARLDRLRRELASLERPDRA